MNAYTEAKNLFEELFDRIEEEEREEAEEMTLNELIEHYDYYDYCYSYYTADLFDAIANCLYLVGYCEELEKEFGFGIASEPMMINEAIFHYIIDQYGNYTKSDFKY